MDETERRILNERRSELAEAERSIERLQARAKCLRMIVSGLQGLEDLDSAVGPADYTDSETPRANEQTVQAVNDARPFVTAKEAIQPILDESDREWDAAALVEAIDQRGIRIDSDKPIDAVRAALIRLYRAGQIDRVGHGAYRRQTTVRPVGDVDMLVQVKGA
jgi:hypothetical protein